MRSMISAGPAAKRPPRAAFRAFAAAAAWGFSIVAAGFFFFMAGGERQGNEGE